MRYHTLGSSNLNVSDICLGTMTWGIQNTQADADEQLDYALDAGINFIDTAEMYPVPPNEQTYGDTGTVHWRLFTPVPGEASGHGADDKSRRQWV